MRQRLGTSAKFSGLICRGVRPAVASVSLIVEPLEERRSVCLAASAVPDLREVSRRPRISPSFLCPRQLACPRPKCQPQACKSGFVAAAAALAGNDFADSGGWNLFDPPTLESMYKETRAVFR